MNVCCCSKREFNMSSYALHSHNEFEIILNTAGNCTAIIDGTEYSIKEGTVIIIPPNIEHEAFSDTYFIDFFVRAKQLNFERPYVTKDNDGIILSLMDMLHTVMIEKETKYKSIADSLLDTICRYIEKYINVNYKYSFVNTLKNIITENFADPFFELSEAIGKMGYNKDYLRRCFVHDVGKTPREFLNDIRINRAKMLLIQDDFISVKAISESCGFSDNLYFSTVFKKTTGMSPMLYRKIELDGENKDGTI